MRFDVSFLGWSRDAAILEAMLDIEQAGEHFRTTKVEASRKLVILAARSLGEKEVKPSSDSPSESPKFERGFFRLSVRRLEDLLNAGAIEPAVGGELFILQLPDDDEGIRQLVDFATGDKSCSYQVQEGRDLYCTAASQNDVTALPVVLNTGRRLAPTSRPVCAACTLPDTDYICSHFLHPQIAATLLSDGSLTRHFASGLCDLDREEFGQHNACHAGGNPCWTRVIEPEPASTLENVPPPGDRASVG